jgi:hypothetical protein
MVRKLLLAVAVTLGCLDALPWTPGTPSARAAFIADAQDRQALQPWLNQGYQIAIGPTTFSAAISTVRQLAVQRRPVQLVPVTKNFGWTSSTSYYVVYR